MTLIVAQEGDTGEPVEPHTEPEIALALGEVKAIVEDLQDEQNAQPEPAHDHSDIMAAIAAVDAKVDAHVAECAAMQEPVVLPEPEPELDTVVVSEPEPEPPEHPFFKNVFGES
jgi:hypothetical protein